jgi:hypothetical protein
MSSDKFAIPVNILPIDLPDDRVIDTFNSPLTLAVPVVTPIQIGAPESFANVVVNQPGPVSMRISSWSSSPALTGSCGSPFVNFSHPDFMFRTLKSLFQVLGVNPVGVSGQPVASTVDSEEEYIKGCAGGSPPSRWLTKCDFSGP